jgi:hypothetical protein
MITGDPRNLGVQRAFVGAHHGVFLLAAVNPGQARQLLMDASSFGSANGESSFLLGVCQYALKGVIPHMTPIDHYIRVHRETRAAPVGEVGESAPSKLHSRALAPEL